MTERTERTLFTVGAYRRQVLSLAELAQSALPHLQQAIWKRAPVRLSIDAGTSRVYVDRASIERMLLQLVLDAADRVRAPPGAIEICIVGISEDLHGAHISSAAPERKSWARGTAKFVQLIVADNGAGSSAGAGHHRWLEQPDPGSTVTSFRLRHVRDVVRDHGGRVFVDELPKDVTIVRVELPALSPSHLPQE